MNFAKLARLYVAATAAVIASNYAVADLFSAEMALERAKLNAASLRAVAENALDAVNHELDEANNQG
jgi:hypothetical protein